MDRRGFLRCLGIGVAAAVAPKVTYSFLGGILRPRPTYRPQDIDHIINPPLVAPPSLKCYIETVRGMRELTAGEFIVEGNVATVTPKIQEGDGRYISIRYVVSGAKPFSLHA